MPITQAVLSDCPKIIDGTLNSRAFRILDAMDEEVLFQLEGGAAGCVMRCCNGRYVSCKTFQAWVKNNGFAHLLERNPLTMDKSLSKIEGEE